MHMKVIFAYRWILLLALAPACMRSANDESRERVASALRDSLGGLATDPQVAFDRKSLGEAADPEVAFLRDSTHLLILLSTVAFPTRPESAWTDEARKIGSFAFRHYEKADQLDSLTLQYHERIRPGMWWIRHSDTFSAGQLRKLR